VYWNRLPRDDGGVTLVHVLLIALAVAAAVAASLHAVLYKRDVRASLGWAGFIWIAPFFGPAFYFLFGINRIRRRALALRPRDARAKSPERRLECVPTLPSIPLARIGDRVVRSPMIGCNRIETHSSGEAAFAAMEAAIDSARHSVSVAVYIFELDATGNRVADALARAAARGIEVRALVDAVGSRTSGGEVVAQLVERGAKAARFLPPRVPGMRTMNLRNHRKLLVVDGRHAFTGGMNVSDDYALAGGATPIRDTQFEIEGPIVRDIQETFAFDWLFTTGERLEGEAWFPALAPAGAIAARVVADGPDEDFELTRWLILGALAAARRDVRIVTPYFVPDTALITALAVAALRGVRVDILLPEKPDHPGVKWASDALLWQVLEKGCRVWFTPPPFDHSKLFAVDGIWAFFGSSNWDARSLRLNFELNIETFDATFARAMEHAIDARRTAAREITLAEMDARPFPRRLRDAIARLASPYL
jgi:cardiolipin synthase